jgi:hypothetical protein
MGIYSHLDKATLEAMRDNLVASLQARLTAPTKGGFNGRTVEYLQRSAEIRKEIETINSELARQSGTATHRPIYLV